MITKRITKKTETFLGYDQCGFLARLGTQEAIAVIRTLCKQSLEVEKEVSVWSVAREKAFDRVN